MYGQFTHSIGHSKSISQSVANQEPLICTQSMSCMQPLQTPSFTGRHTTVHNYKFRILLCAQYLS